MTSAVNEKAIRERDKRIAADRETDRTVIIALMSAPNGRRWVWNRLAEAQIFVESESLDPAVLAYEKGRRNAGLRLLNDVTKFTPQDYIRMTEENTSVSINPQEESPSDE